MGQVSRMDRNPLVLVDQATLDPARPSSRYSVGPSSRSLCWAELSLSRLAWAGAKTSRTDRSGSIGAYGSPDRDQSRVARWMPDRGRRPRYFTYVYLPRPGDDKAEHWHPTSSSRHLQRSVPSISESARYWDGLRSYLAHWILESDQAEEDKERTLAHGYNATDVTTVHCGGRRIVLM